jgi:phosphinothricin acetyltransferase
MTVQIRLAQDADAAAIAAIYRPIVEQTAISFEITAPNRDEIAQRIASTLPEYPWVVCDIGGRIAGYAYASRHRLRRAYRWSVDTSVYVDDRFQRRGLGRGLYVSLFTILSAQGFINAFAGIALPNPASVALHESLGFEAIGIYRQAGYKLDRWHDVGWWQLTLKEPEASPAEPTDLRVIVQRSGWEDLLTRGEAFVRTDVNQA